MGTDASSAAATSAIEGVRLQLTSLDAAPLPGRGATAARWRVLAAIARDDLSRARIAEGHLDARAILVELGRGDLLATPHLLGVWAAEPGRLRATPTDAGWRLDGEKGWCSGSDGLDAALVTATAPDGPRLFFVDTADVSPQAGTWLPMAMAATRSDTVTFALEVPAEHAVGGPEAYVSRPGFGHGGCGVAACWWGGALGVLDGLRDAVRRDAADIGAFGRAHARLAAAGSVLAAAADRIDGHPGDEGVALEVAGHVRLVVAGAARSVLDEAIEAMGASGLCHRPSHSARVADLLVYLGQHRAASAAADHGRRLIELGVEPAW